MGEELQHVTDWAQANDPDPNLIWKSGMWEQVMFVRDVLARLLAQKPDHTYDDYRGLVRVCGEHRSKSVKLPVFSIEWKRGIRFTLRYNFYDWGVSVEAAKPLAWDFAGLFRPDSVDSCLEGFPADRKFGPYNANPSRFTFGVGDKHDLYAALFLIVRQFPAPAARLGAGEGE